MIQLGGTLIVAAIATVIFSLKDIQKSIGKVTSQLLTNTEVITLLSNDAKARLEKRIVLDRLEPPVSYLQPELYERLTSIRDRYLNSFHLQNFAEDITISPYPSNPNFIYRNSTRSFKVVPNHLTDVNRTFTLFYGVQLKIPKDVPISKENFLIHFEAKAGEDQFGLKDEDVDESFSGSLRVIKLRFIRSIDVKRSLDIIFSTRYLGWADDNVDIFHVRYPTNGFRMYFRYLDSLCYDASWFKLFKDITSEAGFDLDRAAKRDLNNGIMVFTNDCVFPGEGVAISWHSYKPGEKVPDKK